MNQDQESLLQRRLSLLETICQAANEIKTIDDRMREVDVNR